MQAYLDIHGVLLINNSPSIVVYNNNTHTGALCLFGSFLFDFLKC